MAAVDEQRQLIQRDRESGGRRYPEQAHFVLNDERLVQLLERRFEQGEQLRRIYELDY